MFLRSKERYADRKKAHLCNTHADTQCHTHAQVYTTISRCKKKIKKGKKWQPTYKFIPPSELFKCNIVKFEPVLGCGSSW